MDQNVGEVYPAHHTSQFPEAYVNQEKEFAIIQQNNKGEYDSIYQHLNDRDIFMHPSHQPK